MRRALKQNSSRRRVADISAIPAPVGGWNTESPLAAMRPEDAVLLENWIPRASRVELRRGFTQQCTGTDSEVESLVTWRGSASGDKLFACAGANIYDVTTAGALPSADYASATSARWDHTNFANDAGAFAILCNGADTPLKYDGSAFATLAITGSSGAITLDPTTLKGVTVHKRRLWFIQKDSLRAWFLQTNAIQGEASLLDFGPLFSKGGRLTALGTWSLDGGAGMDDVLVAVSTEGQLAIYQGLDPTDANQWSLVGVFDVAKPLGERALIKWGADLALVTEDGILPMSQALNKDRDEARKRAITAKIASAFSKAAKLYRDNFGWGTALYSGRGALAIFNVPTVELTTSEQYVQSIEGGGWCKFTGIPAFCWGDANDSIYFGSTDGVYEWDKGSTDNGEIISGDVKTAFNTFRYAGEKVFTMARPLLKAPSIIKPAIEILTDYRERTPTATPTVVEPGDVSASDEDEIRYAWTSVTGVGHTGAARMRVSIIGSEDVDRVAVSATDRLITSTGGDYVITAPNLPLDVPVELVGFNVMYERGAPI